MIINNDRRMLLEQAGTILMGSLQKSAYLYVNQTTDRMQQERSNAERAGVDHLYDFVFVFDGTVIALSYEELKARLLAGEMPDQPVQ